MSGPSAAQDPNGVNHLARFLNRRTARNRRCTIEIMPKKKRRGVWLFLAVLLFPIYFVVRWLKQFANS